MNPRSKAALFLVTFIVSAALPGTAPAQPADSSFGAALAGGEPMLDLRLRHEHVRQDNALSDANAATLRARLGYRTAQWHGLRGLLEFSGTADLSDGRYNSQRNGETGRSVVADPNGSRINRAQLELAPIQGVDVSVGRQRLNYDNARFVGNVGWRQNEQVFDAVQLRTELVRDATLSYAYLHRVNGILLTGSRMQGHLLNARYAPLPQFALSGYGYWLDFREDRPANADRRTLGLRASGSFAGAVPLHYTLELARQHDHADAPELEADYWLAELRTETGPVSWTVGYEVLGGDGSTGFQTPLATLHAFQGWADIFLQTPADGVRDLHFSVGGAVAGTRLLAKYHRYEADTGGADYGREWNFMATRSFGGGLSGMLKFAEYRARELAVNTRKLWVMSEYRF
jgi:hypothetical protein